MESIEKCMESTWNCMESTWKCMESIWNPPGIAWNPYGNVWNLCENVWNPHRNAWNPCGNVWNPYGIHLEMHGIHMESIWKCKTFIRPSQADDLVTCYGNTHQCLDQSSYQPTPTSYFRPAIWPRPSCDERMINRFPFWVPGELSCVCV